MQNFIISFSPIVILSVLLIGCQQPAEEQVAKDVVVDVISVDQSTAISKRSFNAQVIPAELTNLAFRIGGELEFFPLREGAKVKKGQELARIYSDEQQESLKDATATYTLAQKQLQRGKSLFKRGSISESELDEMEANYELAAANLKAAKLKLSYTVLKAPFDGIVGTVYKEVYEPISAGEPVATLYLDDRVYVQVPVTDSITIRFDPTNDKNVNQHRSMAEYTNLNKSFEMSYLERTLELSPDSQTYLVWLQMPMPNDQIIMPNQPVTIHVDLEKAGIQLSGGYLVPLTALQASTKKNQFVAWKLEDNTAIKTNVTVIQITQDGALVSDGVKAGDKLINTRLDRLRDGLVVKVKDAGAQ